jgi:hypothetical protein
MRVKYIYEGLLEYMDDASCKVRGNLAAVAVWVVLGTEE